MSLLLAVQEVASPVVLETALAVLHNLSSMVEEGWEEEEEEDACSPNEESPEEVDLCMAVKGFGANGEVYLSKRLWDRGVPKDFLMKYRV